MLVWAWKVRCGASAWTLEYILHDYIRSHVVFLRPVVRKNSTLTVCSSRGIASLRMLAGTILPRHLTRSRCPVSPLLKIVALRLLCTTTAAAPAAASRLALASFVRTGGVVGGNRDSASCQSRTFASGCRIAGSLRWRSSTGVCTPPRMSGGHQQQAKRQKLSDR